MHARWLRVRRRSVGRRDQAGRWIAAPSLLAAFVAPLMTLISGAAPAQEAPDLILHGGQIYTVDAQNSVAESVAIRGDRIAAVGSNAEIEKLAGRQTRKIDLEGRAVIPGLIDSHGHLGGLADSLRSIDLVGTKSFDEIIAKVAERAKSTPKGEWITGRGWDQNDWPEKKFPHHRKLSDAVPDHPVYLTRIDGHAGLANEKALQLSAINIQTYDPEGGKIIRDPQSDEATGVLIDNAQRLVELRIPAMSDEQYRAMFGPAIRECLRHGITTIHDAGVTGRQIDTYKALIDAGEFDLRVYAMISAGDRYTLSKYFAAGPLIGYGDNRLTVRSVKAMIDGALGSRGAALLEPYSDDPGNTGLLVTRPETLAEVVNQALGAGFQVNSHAIGDRGNRIVLDTYEAGFSAQRNAAQTADRDHRFRIEHAQVVALEDIPRFAKLGVIPSMQATHATSDMYWAENRVGPERIKGAYAWRKFLDAGCRIANGSDFPVERVSALEGFYAAITRQDKKGWPEGGWRPEEKMTREEALRSFTIDAAYAAFEEDLKGSIEKGKLADLVVLSKNVMRVEPAEILSAEVEMTLLGGEIVYSAGSER